MKKLIFTTLFTIFFSLISFSQNISEFDNVTNLITEDFTNAETAFPILTSVDNYFIIDNGDYLLSRNNTESEYAIIASATQQVSDFLLKTAIKLGPSSSKRASCGIIIKSQTTGSEALIFEINRKGEYRIKELLVTNTYKYLSGRTSNNGWVKSKIVKSEGEFNSIKILCQENIYDIYVNNIFLTSLFSPSLNKGNMGILIGKDAKSRIAYYYLSVPAETTNNLIEDHMNDFSVTNLSNKIKQLESEILTLRNSNERLDKENISFKNDNTLNQTKKDLQDSKNTVDSLKSETTKLNKKIDETNKQINSLNSDIESKQNRIHNLFTLNKELNNTNNNITSENSSLNTKLSSVQSNLSNSEGNLKSLKSKNSELNTEITKLKSEITSNESIEKKLNSKISDLNTQITDLKSKLSSQKSSSTTSENNLKKKISDKTKEVNLLKSELTSVKKEILSLKKKYATTNNLRTDNDSLKSNLSEAEITITSLNTQVTQLNGTVKELEKQRDDLTISDNKKSEDISLLTSTVDDLYVKVENMKKVLIYKGFEEGGIDSENINSTKVENNTTKQKTNKKKKDNKKENKKQKTSEDVTYTVQIATYGSKVTLAKFKGLRDVYYIDSKNETYLYMSGRFDNSNLAVEHKNKLVEMGYKDAFVVKLNNK
jgi:uncharacterized coiled-coil DUF342 family protein